ncbi:MAG: GNAT family N-acetyltransferase [Pseudomonadota bacterium]
MLTTRLAESQDLPGLLTLYRESGFSDPVADSEQPGIWQDILSRDGVYVVVASLDAEIVSTCTLITAPNLLRGGRAHGFLENIATLPTHRRRGHGRRVIAFALKTAWEVGCFHVLLQSGKSDPGVHAFYQSLGFEPDLRTAYAARRPEDQA